MARTLHAMASLVFVFGLATHAAADSWRLPEKTTQLSSDGRWRFTATPRELSSQLDYFRDKVDGKDKAGGGTGGPRSAHGHLEQRAGDDWITAWDKDLLNDVAPVDVLVANSGRVVTLDNWHSMGYGDHVVVVYDNAGGTVCSLALDDLFPIVVVDQFPRSVSSIRWRDRPRFSNGEQTLALTIASPGPQPEVENGEFDLPGKTFELGLRLNDCSVSPPSRTVWHSVLAAAQESVTEEREHETKRRAEFIAPLNAPDGNDAQAWGGYLFQAWFRIHTLTYADHPRIQFLIPRGQTGHEASATELREELEELTQGSDPLVIGSTAPQELIGVLRDFAARTPPEALRSKRLGLALDSADFGIARDMLQASGATLIQIDPTWPLPQNEENLRRAEQSEREQAAEMEQRERRARQRKAWWAGY